jgi:hypothetical protein
MNTIGRGADIFDKVGVMDQLPDLLCSDNLCNKLITSTHVVVSTTAWSERIGHWVAPKTSVIRISNGTEQNRDRDGENLFPHVANMSQVKNHCFGG